MEAFYALTIKSVSTDFLLCRTFPRSLLINIINEICLKFIIKLLYD